MKKLTVSACIIALALVACKSSEKSKKSKKSTTTTATAPLPAGTPTFATDIKPIMDKYCVSCHNENEKAGYNFKEMSSAKKAGANGELLGTIKHMDNFDPMPAHADQLDAATIGKIEHWVKTGMN